MHRTEIALSDVPLRRLVCLKYLNEHRSNGDHSRWVFISPRGDRDRLVWKLWNPGYVRRESILTGFESGLYDPRVVPAFRGLIVHAGICRGYVMQAGVSLKRPSADLIHALWENTRRSRHFALQYRRSHVMATPSGPSLIDIETVYPVTALPELRGRGLYPEDPDYGELVSELHARAPTDDRPSSEPVAAMAQAHFDRLSMPRVTSPTGLADFVRRKAMGVRLRAKRLRHQLTDDGRDRIMID